MKYERNGKDQVQDQSPLLGISIPTFRRTKEFQRLSSQLRREIAKLSNHNRSLLQVAILENPSDASPSKKKIFEAELGIFENSWFLSHAYNIGGDANLEAAYKASGNCDYSWVLGDDEQLVEDSLETVIRELREDSAIGLFILRDTTYQINANIARAAKWRNYAVFAQEACEHQPHLLIAHSLVSGNIIRSCLHNPTASQQERLIIAPRQDLHFCFAHMKAFLTSMSRNENHLGVRIIPSPVLDTSSRSMPEEHIDDYSNQIVRLYTFYSCWLAAEFGVDINILLKVFNERKSNPPQARFTYLLRRVSRKLIRLLSATRVA